MMKQRTVQPALQPVGQLAWLAYAWWTLLLQEWYPPTPLNSICLPATVSPHPWGNIPKETPPPPQGNTKDA